MKKIKKRNGFTLMEVVAVIVIIIILSVMSGPIYNSYSTKAKQTEGYAVLGAILSAQLTYYNDAGNFLYSKQTAAGENMFTNYEPILGIDCRTNKYYKTFCVASSDYDGNIQYNGNAISYGFIAKVQGPGVKLLGLRYNKTLETKQW